MPDLPKAYDRNNFGILLMKLCKNELPTWNILLCEYMLRNGFIHVSFNGCKKSDWLIDNGTCQGGINSPLLFGHFCFGRLLDYFMLLKVGILECPVDQSVSSQ